MPQHPPHRLHHVIHGHVLGRDDHLAAFDPRLGFHQHLIAYGNLQVAGGKVVNLAGPLKADADNAYRLLHAEAHPFWPAAARAWAARSKNSTSAAVRSATCCCTCRRKASRLSRAASTDSTGTWAARCSSSSYRSTLTTHGPAAAGAASPAAGPWDTYRPTSKSRSHNCSKSTVSSSS